MTKTKPRTTKTRAKPARVPLVTVSIARRPRRQRGGFAFFLIRLVRELRTLRTTKPTTPVKAKRPDGKTGVTRAEGAERFAAFKAQRPDLFTTDLDTNEGTDPDTEPGAVDLDAEFGEVYDPGI